MGVAEELLELDPVLQRVFFDGRRFAPFVGREAIVNCELYNITELKAAFLKAKSLEQAEDLQRRMRRAYLIARSHCEGYVIDLPAGHDDGCQHVVEFAHRGRNHPAFDIDHRARAALWYRYCQRPPPPWV